MKVLLSTDTSCLINYEVLNNYPISIFNLNVIIDNVEFLDGITIKQDSLLEAMNSNKAIKTSTPPLGLVIDYFEKLFEEGILVGELYTKLGVPGMEHKGPAGAAKKLFEFLEK